MLMREKVWFPFKDALVETCDPSQPERTTMHGNAPTGPWEEVSIDFASVDGEALLIITNDYSRYPPTTTCNHNIVWGHHP